MDEGEALLDDSEARRQRRQGSEPNKAAENEDSTIGVMAVLRHPLHRPAVVAVVGVMLAQQLCGMIYLYDATLPPLFSSLVFPDLPTVAQPIYILDG